MFEARWEQPLDFSLVHPRQPISSLADLLSAHTNPDRIRTLSQLKARFWERCQAKDKQYVKPSPEPRYDQVLTAGLRLADEENTSQ